MSQDPIRLAGGNPTLYGYVPDTNINIDTLGLTCKPGYAYRQGSATDPGLNDFVNGLRSRGINVIGTNLEIIDLSTGKVVGEVDVLTPNAAIQFKDGSSSAAAVIDQINNKTAPFVDVPVVGFIAGNNGKAAAAQRTVNNAGRHVLATNDIDILSSVIK